MVRRRWPWMLAAGVLAVAATAAFVAGMPVSYTAKATVLISSQQIPENLVRSTLPEDSFERVNAMISEILARERLSTVIEKYDLYPELRQKKSMAEITALMREKVNVEVAQGLQMGGYRQEAARLLVVEFEGPEAELAANVTNELAGMFVTQSIELRGQQARRTTEFLRVELARADEALREQNRKITEFKQRHQGELPAEGESTLRRLEMLQQQRQSLASQISEAETRMAMVASSPSQPTTPEARLAQARTELAKELAVKKEAHPDVRALRQEIGQLEAEVGRGASAGGASVVAAAQRQVAQLRGELAKTELELRDLDVRVARMPARQEELSALEEKATVLRDNYLEFLRKVKEAELAESLESQQQGERFSVIDSAVPPASPNRSRLKFALLGLVASAGLAGAVGAWLEWRDPVVVGAADLEDVLDAAPLGAVPRIG